MSTPADRPIPGIVPAQSEPPKLSRREGMRLREQYWEQLERAAAAVEAARTDLASAVAAARAAGLSWQDIGEGLGLDRETARRRYGGGA